MKLYTTSRISRRLGERFFFKPERDSSPKSAMMRRPYPPGVHGKRRRRALSEYGVELAEKQKVRFLYGLTNTILGRYVDRAGHRVGKTKPAALFELLERRLDNVVFRLGLAASRRAARHIVAYAHIEVNGKRTRSPSTAVKVGDRIAVGALSRSRAPFAGLTLRLRKHEPPSWLVVDAEECGGTVKRLPDESDFPPNQSLAKVIEFYSR